MYDIVMRLPLVIWVSVAAIAQIRGVILLVNAPIGTVQAVHIAMRLSAVAFMLLIAAATVFRGPPSAKASGLEPRVSALAGTFLMYGVGFFPRRELSLSLEMISTVSILIGMVGAVVALSQLGRSFSLMAETRRLVTSGPYRFVRHPLYLTEEIAIIGLFIQFVSVWTALLLAVQIACQMRRMDNEELVLSASFPEYTTYRQHTARLIPGVY
jgi:protein-S-isoprenylcysteine O-methyltransferase Ste14